MKVRYIIRLCVVTDCISGIRNIRLPSFYRLNWEKDMIRSKYKNTTDLGAHMRTL